MMLKYLTTTGDGTLVQSALGIDFQDVPVGKILNIDTLEPAIQQMLTKLNLAHYDRSKVNAFCYTGTDVAIPMHYIDKRDKDQYGALITGPAILVMNVEGTLDASLLDTNGNPDESAFLDLMDQINTEVILSEDDHIPFTIWILTSNSMIILHYDSVLNRYVMQ